MTPVTRLILVAMLMLPLVGELAAQESTAATDTAASTGTATTTTAATDTTATAATTTDTAATDTAEPAEETLPNSYDLRAQFSSILRGYPSELVTILSLDPTLLSDEHYLARYPELAKFVAEHPQVRHNPRFYLGQFQVERDNSFGEFLEPIMALCGFLLFAFALSWIVRLGIEQRRWTRLARTQSEVHNKILDRFGTSAELLEYIRTPAGSKFLESAPIPLHTEPTTQQTAQPRVIFTVQIGVIVAAAAMGMILVSLRLTNEAGKGLFAMGVIALCIGLGFIASAAVSIFLSRRLAAWETPESNDPGQVR
jgi:hypothetical protein